MRYLYGHFSGQCIIHLTGVTRFNCSADTEKVLSTMKTVLLTGMSGTGKSMLICELAARGYKAIDADSDEWSEWVNVTGDGPEGPDAGRDWVWREHCIQSLMVIEDADILFISGCASIQGTFGHLACALG
jgi:hypothetical protein